jgi:hypothetical protein
MTADQTEREAMTDDWLKDQFKAAMVVGGESVPNILRGFANRVLQTFGDREGMRDALNIAFEKSTSQPVAAQPADSAMEVLRELVDLDACYVASNTWARNTAWWLKWRECWDRARALTRQGDTAC